MPAVISGAQGAVLDARGDVPMSIGGRTVGGVANEWNDVVAPLRDGVRLGRALRARAIDVDCAVVAAHGAQPGWRRLPATERQVALLAVAGTVAEHAE